MSWDPLNVSMDLFGKMRKLAKLEQEVEEKYSEMALTFENFAVELLTVSFLIIRLAFILLYFCVELNKIFNMQFLSYFK